MHFAVDVILNGKECFAGQLCATIVAFPALKMILTPQNRDKVTVDQFTTRSAYKADTFQVVFFTERHFIVFHKVFGEGLPAVGASETLPVPQLAQSHKTSFTNRFVTIKTPSSLIHFICIKIR